MRRLLCLAAAGISLALCSLGHAAVHYQIEFKPDARQVEVGIEVDSPAKLETFHIPAWSPGFYQIAHYQAGISHVEAKTSDGQTLAFRHTDSREWQVDDPDGKPFRLTYMVDGNDEGLGFFGTEVDLNDGFVNGASAFMYADGRLTEPVELKISPPPGWDLATPLDADASGAFAAGGYDELIDSPIQVGRFIRKSFTAVGIPYQVIYVAPDGRPRTNVDAETARFAKLVAPAVKMFGSAPFKHYTFFIHLAPGSFSGGLEHRACTVINLQNTNPLDVDDLITHEYFHAWNVKNIRPAVLGPFDYTKEVRTDNLWFAEGVTDYYAKLDAYQSGLENVSYLFGEFTREIATLHLQRDRTKYTLAQASHGAWEGGSEGLGDLSYYDKGLLVGLVLDAEIRGATAGQKSLDDVMRLLYQRHHLPLPGYAEDEIRSTVSEVAGTDLGAVYDKLVYSTQEIPYDELHKLGLRVLEPDTAFRDTGFRIDASGRIVELSDAVKGEGLQVGDTVTLEKLDGGIAKFAGQRGHQSFHVTVQLKSILWDQFVVEPDPLASAETAKLREAWLKR
jgi:predicted metalloprotease with PDZ domain